MRPLFDFGAGIMAGGDVTATSSAAAAGSGHAAIAPSFGLDGGFLASAGAGLIALILLLLWLDSRAR